MNTPESETPRLAAEAIPQNTDQTNCPHSDAPAASSQEPAPAPPLDEALRQHLVRRVASEGRDELLRYHAAQARGAASHYADTPATAKTKERMRAFHAGALEFIMSLPLPAVKKHRGGGT